MTVAFRFANVGDFLPARSPRPTSKSAVIHLPLAGVGDLWCAPAVNALRLRTDAVL